MRSFPRRVAKERGSQAYGPVKYNVSEIFYSIQGEGPLIGWPSIFVRFSGCNLRCQWGKNKCDTPYTSWNPEVNMRTIQDVVEIIGLLSEKHECDNIIITGGEPTIQNLDPLCDILRQQGYLQSIETNGTGSIPEQIDLIVCSPKLSDSTPEQEPQKTLHTKNRKLFLQNDALRRDNESVFFKFVIEPKTSHVILQEIEEIIDHFGIRRNQIYLMPQGVTKEELDRNSLVAAEIAKRLTVNFSPRLHIELWGNTRGT